MKKLLLLLLGSMIGLTNTILAADYYFTNAANLAWSTTDPRIDWAATNTDGYTVWSNTADGSAVKGVPGEGDNVYLGAKYVVNPPSTGNYEMTSIKSDKKIANLNVFLDATPLYSSWIQPDATGSFSFAVTNDFNVTSSASTAKAFTIRSYGTAKTLSVSVGGSVNVTGVSNSTVAAILGADNDSYNLKGFSITKNFNIDKARVSVNLGNLSSFDVSGTLNMLNESRIYFMQRRSNAAQVTKADVSVNLGGISGSGIIGSGTTATAYTFTSTATFTLKNSGKNTFSGIFQDNTNSDDVQYNLIMDGASTGKQTLILSDTSSIKGGITVKNGTLSLYTESSINGDIDLNGGVFETYSNGGISQVYANGFYWTDGKFSIGGDRQSK